MPPDDPVAADTQPRMKRAVQAIALIAFVVLFNLALYVLILFLIGRQYIDGGSLFPPLVLFLSFALSVGVILIVGLGEKIDTSNIDNEWVKKIGVGPIMTIVAVLISILASFSPLADKIISSNTTLKLKFMLANIGVTCVTGNPNKAPQATELLTVISSKDEGYIRDVIEFLSDKELMKQAKNPNPRFVVRERGGDAEYKTLFQYARSDAKGSGSLLDDLNTDSKWVAYTVAVKDPALTTSIPVPTIYERNHTTRLFVIVSEPPPAKQPELASLDVIVGPSGTRKVLPLFQVEIVPERPRNFWQLTNLDVKVYSDHICWHIGG